MTTSVTLKTGDVITLRDHDELTERLNRPVEVANSRGAPVGVELRKKLKAAGFDPDKPGEWLTNQEAQLIISDLTLDEFNRLNGYKQAVIAAMVSEWPFNLPITEDGALDLPPAQFEELANLANAAWRGEEIDVDPNPTPGGGDSTD
jgi:hypothetical protein